MLLRNDMWSLYSANMKDMFVPQIQVGGEFHEQLSLSLSGYIGPVRPPLDGTQKKRREKCFTKLPDILSFVQMTLQHSAHF